MCGIGVFFLVSLGFLFEITPKKGPARDHSEIGCSSKIQPISFLGEKKTMLRLGGCQAALIGFVKWKNKVFWTECHPVGTAKTILKHCGRVGFVWEYYLLLMSIGLASLNFILWQYVHEIIHFNI